MSDIIMPFSNYLLKGFFIMEQKDLMFIQSQIGYEFKNLDLLQQAFIRRSFSEENGGENNEVLEFIGDKVLDLFAVKYLTEKHGFLLSEQDDAEVEFDEFSCEKTEAELTEIKKILVQKKTLANRIDVLGLADYLLMGKGDILQNISEENSVKEDLFEAILGAIAIDSSWNMEALENAVSIMLAPESILSDSDTEDYVSLIQEWAYNKTGGIPLYHFDESGYQITWYDGFQGENQNLPINHELVNKTKYHCLLKLSDDLPIFRGFGKTQTEARRNVCKLAYEYLCKKDMWLSISDEIDNPNKDEAINQLEILARRDYFSIPTYEFNQTYDNDGNPVWESICRIAEKEKSFSAKSSSKKDAKKSAAYKMLQYVLKD